jgi:hypothetical protein
VSMTNSGDRVEIITSVQRRRRWTAVCTENVARFDLLIESLNVRGDGPRQRIGRIVSHALVGGLHHAYVRI